MIGTVLHFDKTTSSGLISGEDGNRYPFTLGDVKGEFQRLTVGSKVDFVANDGAATDVYPAVSASTTSVENTRIIAAVLAFFLGGLGIHKFYLKKNTAGIIMLAVSLGGFILLAIPTLIIGIIAFIEAIIYIIKSNEDFEAQYINGDKSWF